MVRKRRQAQERFAGHSLREARRHNGSIFVWPCDGQWIPHHGSSPCKANPGVGNRGLNAEDSIVMARNILRKCHSNGDLGRGIGV